MTNQIQIAQADREAAHDWFVGGDARERELAANILAGREHHSLVNAFAKHRLSAQSMPVGWEVEYEVWQRDAFGDGDAMVAGSTSLEEAQHYATVYSQDGSAWVVEVRRTPLTNPSSTTEGGEG